MQLIKKNVSRMPGDVGEITVRPKRTTGNGVVLDYMLNILNGLRKIDSVVVRLLSSVTVKPYTKLEAVLWKLFNDTKNDRILYKKLLGVFPELSETRPGVYESFYRVIGTSNPDDCFFELETKPFIKEEDTRELYSELIKVEISGTGLKYKAGFIIDHITAKIKVLYITHPTDKMAATRSNLLFVIRGFGVMVGGSGIPERF